MKKITINLITLLSAMLIFNNATLQSQSFYVSSRNSHAIKLFDAAGKYIRDIVTSGSGNLSYPQEVLYHSSKALLVTGRGNTYIKKYDISTGVYLGNFTSGYLLDNPTKTTIWKDSLLYVSQWGVTQNKVARFDLSTGAYVDEFTSIGISNAGGHAWDTLGNLYVAKYGTGGNGEVLKFDPTGIFIGVFIPTGIISGPVNLWFDNTNALYVEDWTLGKVFKFNGSTGSYISTLVTGLTNAEGFAFDKIGNLYLCDWTSNVIYKYGTSSTLTPFITSGGLMAPNSILLHSSSILSVSESSQYPKIAQTKEDSLNVIKALNNYIDGFYYGDTSKIIRSISNDVVKYGYYKNKNTGLYEGEPMSYKEMIDYAAKVGVSRKNGKQLPANAPRKTEIYEVLEQSASAKITAWWGSDYILLEKKGDKWMIRMVLWQGPLK